MRDCIMRVGVLVSPSCQAAVASNRSYQPLPSIPFQNARLLKLPWCCAAGGLECFQSLALRRGLLGGLRKSGGLNNDRKASRIRQHRVLASSSLPSAEGDDVKKLDAVDPSWRINGVAVNGTPVDLVPRAHHPTGPLQASDRQDVVGVLGGMSPTVTADFMMKVVIATPAQRDWDHIPLVVCSVPQIPDLAGAVMRLEAQGGSPPLEVMSPLPKLLEKRRFLEQAGARCIVMPSHLAHYWYNQLQEGCSVPFLHIADAVAQELDQAELEPLEAGGKPKVGLLGSQEVLKARIYQDRLQARGYEVVLPDKATMEHAVLPGLEAMDRGDQEGARNLLGIAVQVLLVNAVNVVVLACGQISAVFPPDDPLLVRCLSPTAALARHTVRWAQGVRAKDGPLPLQ